MKLSVKSTVKNISNKFGGRKKYAVKGKTSLETLKVFEKKKTATKQAICEYIADIKHKSVNFCVRKEHRAFNNRREVKVTRLKAILDKQSVPNSFK